MRAAARRGCFTAPADRARCAAAPARAGGGSQGYAVQAQKVLNVYADHTLGLLTLQFAHCCLLCDLVCNCCALPTKWRPQSWSAIVYLPVLVIPLAVPKAGCNAVSQGQGKSCRESCATGRILTGRLPTAGLQNMKRAAKEAREQTANHWTGPSWSCHTCRRLGWLPGSIFTEFGACMCAVLSVKTSKEDPEGCSMC